MRRKSKPIPKSSHNDDKKVSEIAKKAGLQEISGMEEANVIMEDGNVVQFTNPKVRGLMQANAFVLHGSVSQTTTTKLSPDMKGEYSRQPQMSTEAQRKLSAAVAKIQQAMASGKISENDLKNPETSSELFEKVGLSEEEAKLLSASLPGLANASGGEEVPQ